MRPATRVDDVVIFADGTSRALTEIERAFLDAGGDVRLDPRSGQRTPLVGEGRAELYARLNEQAAREVASWPDWKREGIVEYPRARARR